MVALFNKTHPGIHVSWVQTPGGQPTYDKMFTATKVNNEPDLGQIKYQYLPNFESTGALVDLSLYGAASIKDQFVPWTWNQVVLGNAIYAIPGDTGPLGMYYREDLFKKYNIAVPTTWAQYADAAAILSRWAWCDQVMTIISSPTLIPLASLQPSHPLRTMHQAHLRGLDWGLLHDF